MSPKRQAAYHHHRLPMPGIATLGQTSYVITARLSGEIGGYRPGTEPMTTGPKAKRISSCCCYGVIETDVAKEGRGDIILLDEQL